MSSAPFTAIDHVQLAMPAGQETIARRFYVELLGMAETAKPAKLAKRGGCWFTSGSVQLHLGVEADFRAAKKAHPALQCSDYDTLTARLRAAGVEIVDDSAVPGVRRCHIADPFGNRIELIQSR
jgi:catechol 2,3-dioxygenase-like lactoylglutathione lyase family enzyme